MSLDGRRVANLTHVGAGRRALAVAGSRLHALLYRVLRGRGVARWFGAPVVVLETVGRRSGAVRRTPVLFLEREADLVVLAANAGSDRPPAWWLNLRDAGGATVIRAGRRTDVHPRVLEDAEREDAWQAYCAMYPAAAHYAGFTERELPLIALEPREPSR